LGTVRSPRILFTNEDLAWDFCETRTIQFNVWAMHICAEAGFSGPKLFRIEPIFVGTARVCSGNAVVVHDGLRGFDGILREALNLREASKCLPSSPSSLSFKEHKPIERRMIVQPLKSASEGTCPSPDPDRFPRDISYLRGK
jgi:hypothetical protein